MTGSVYRPAPTAQLAKLAISTTFAVFAERVALLFVLSLIVFRGPAGEGTGTGSAELFCPAIFCGFACGLFADTFGGRLSMILAAVASAVIMLLAPGLLLLVSADRLAVGAIVALCSLGSVLYSVGRLVLTSTLASRRDLIKVNAALLVCSSIATLYSAYLFSLIRVQVAPAQALEACSALSFLAAAVAALVRSRSIELSRVRREKSLKALLAYMRDHVAARDILRLSVILYFPFTFWPMVSLCLILENYQPGGIDLHSLFAFSCAGLAIGALLAPRADRIARPLTVLCATATCVFLTSLICLAASSLATITYAVGIAAVNSGIAIVVLDRLLQATFPRRMLGRAAGCRNALVAALILVCLLVMEQRFEKTSLVIIFRVVGLLHIVFGMLLFVVWPRFRQYLFRRFVWPVLAGIRRIKIDSPHHLRLTRSAIFALQQIGWKDAATVCGAFATPAKFLIVSGRTRSLDRFLLASVGGAVARDESEAERVTRRYLRRGYNVLMLSDDLLEQNSKLLQVVMALSLEQRCPVIPGAAVSSNKGRRCLVFKCGVPFSTHRQITAVKLVEELTTLLTATRAGGEQHVS